MPKRIVNDYLIAQIQEGYTSNFHWVVEEFEDKILRHLTKMVKDTEVAKDLKQDVFEKALANINLYKIGMSFKTWIYKIATNVAIDYLRNKVVRNSVEKDEIDNNDPSVILEKSENSITITEALSKLKPIYRDIIKYRYYEDMSYEDIAKILSIPIGTVKAYLYRAKKALITIIRNQL